MQVGPVMTAIAHVAHRDYMRRTLDVFVGRRIDGGVMMRNADGSSTISYDHEPVREPAEPSFRVDEDEARALLQELIRFFDGGEDTRTLRRDYDAERSRVDKLTDALIARMQ